MLAGARLHLGRLAEASDEFERMIATRRPSPAAAHRGGAGLELRGACAGVARARALVLGYPAAALERGRDAVRLAHDLAQPFNQALAAAYLAMLQQLCADRCRRPSAGRAGAGAHDRVQSALLPRLVGHPGQLCAGLRAARRERQSRACASRSPNSRPPARGCACRTTSGCSRRCVAGPGGPRKGWRPSTRRWRRRARTTSAGGMPSCIACAANCCCAARRGRARGRGGLSSRDRDRPRAAGPRAGTARGDEPGAAVARAATHR